MRIDKYLWCTRYFKTRNQATEACRKGMVRIGGIAVKPSREVLPHDEVQVRRNQVNLQLKVVGIPPQRVAAKWLGLYREDTTPREEMERFEKMQEAREYYRQKGTGRPTKKDRRELDDYLDGPE